MVKAITVRLVGGLGNQLFGYYAGAALAAHHGVNLRLDTSWTRHGITDHGVEIRALDLPGEWLPSDSLRSRLSAPGTLHGRAVAKALRKIPALRAPWRIHEAPGLGDDRTLFDQPPGTRLRGYFQSWRIVDLAVQAGIPRRPRLRRPSEWLEDTVRRAQEERPLVVHVRRGDYAKVPEFGLLSANYYQPAIELLRSQGVTGPLWLFSDEPDHARRALGRHTDIEVLSSPDGPAVEMLAMSHGAGHVIANSTFSWWGAWMNSPGEPVVAPRPWFASGESIDGLLPPSWSTVEASWEATGS